MTREEAITVIERLAHTEAKWPGTEDTLEALDLAITALRPVSREQVEKAWKGEFIHKGRKFKGGVDWYYCSRCLCPSSGVEVNRNFCSNCGAPMTDEAMKMVMERLEELKDVAEEKQTGWISVKDRLPEVGTVLATDGRNVITAPSSSVTADGPAITHWMPLPEPPGDSDAQD